MCALLVGLPDVVVVGVAEWPNWLRVLIEVPSLRPECGCGGRVHRHGVRKVELVDLPIFGRPARLVWRKQRWRCTGCGRCWSDDNGDIATSWCVLTTRAARWSTLQVGRHGRAVTEVAGDLGYVRQGQLLDVVARPSPATTHDRASAAVGRSTRPAHGSAASW